MVKKAWLGGLIIVFAFLVTAAPGIYDRFLSARQQSASTGTPAKDFTLPDQDGQLVSLQKLRGKAVVMDFIYTSCPPGEECPILTGKLAALQHSLTSNGIADRVVILSITFDPNRDTPDVLKSYAKRFGADLSNWHFLRGDEQQTRAVANAYGIDYAADGSGGFTHTAIVILIDPQGQIRFWLPPDTAVGELLKDVQLVL